MSLRATFSSKQKASTVFSSTVPWNVHPCSLWLRFMFSIVSRFWLIENILLFEAKSNEAYALSLPRIVLLTYFRTYQMAFTSLLNARACMHRCHRGFSEHHDWFLVPFFHRF